MCMTYPMPFHLPVRSSHSGQHKRCPNLLHCIHISHVTQLELQCVCLSVCTCGVLGYPGLTSLILTWPATITSKKKAESQIAVSGEEFWKVPQV